MFDKKWLWPSPRQIAIGKAFDSSGAATLAGESCPDHLKKDLQVICGIRVREAGGFPIDLRIDKTITPPEGYSLSLAPTGCSIIGADLRGIMYAMQTLLQIFASCGPGGKWPEVTITDWPAYRARSFMVDMGRSVYSLPLLKRVVRILARLKMNQLHLHLYDDELCGLRFRGLPFGGENPGAITIPELAELVRYAAVYCVEIVPELEGWGHVGSLVYHNKELRGGPGMYSGSSFIICDEMFDLMEELVSQVVGVMPEKSTIHLGLDEANWFPGSSLPEGFNAEDMVTRYYRVLKRIGRKQSKELNLRLWADHGGRPVAEDIQKDVIIEPWNYWITNAEAIEGSIGRYSGEGKMRWMMGAGQSGGQFRGAYHATRYWCRKAIDSPNVEGVNITFWIANDLDRKMISLFAGALYAWNPVPDPPQSEDYEMFDRQVFPIMHWWQGAFRDAFPDDIEQDRGPIVYSGYYLWGDKHHQPVAPTVPIADTWTGHDYANE
ncbi:MAG: family 20 glycosylhydrolase [Spirochaetales bacterium]|nr:family 20 glycosylhydrolase [Spirochaetales bacterium]